MTETQQRFLKDIADRVNGEHIAEVRLYPTVRVGPIESGVAIVATRLADGEMQASDGASSSTGLEAPAAEVEPAAVSEPDVARVDGELLTANPPVITADAAAVDGVSPRETASEQSRLSILTAHFRHTVKGPDRGKWEFFLVHDADAPIETVESVVRGVARRSGEDGEPELLSRDEFQRAIVEPWWTATA